MPGEISRSNPGPGSNTPLVPSWICDMKPDHELEASGKRCRYCWMAVEDFGRYRRPAAKPETKEK